MCFAGFGGVYALVSIVWFAAFYMACAVHLVFLLDSCLESIARVDLVPRVFRDTLPSSHRPWKASLVFYVRGWIALFTRRVQVVFFWALSGGSGDHARTLDTQCFRHLRWSYGHSPSLSIWTPSRPVAVGRWSMSLLCRSCLDLGRRCSR